MWLLHIVMLTRKASIYYSDICHLCLFYKYRKIKFVFPLQYLKHCNQVYMMKDGRVCDHGTHEELMDREQDYAVMVKTHSSDTGDQSQ